MLKNLFRSIGLAVCAALLFMGCNEYTDVYLSARKDFFYAETTIVFREQSSNVEVALKTTDYSCMYERYHEVRTSTHAYSRYYPQLCGQAAHQSDNHTHPLDHSISAYGTSYIYMNADRGWIYFQHDYFVIDPLPDTSNAEIVSLNIGGVLYEGVYRLLPNEDVDVDEIKEIYFHPVHGLLRVVSLQNDVWDREI